MYGALIALLVAALIAVARVYVPWAPKPQGAVVRRLPIPLQARFRNQLVPVGIVSAVVLANIAAGWVAVWVPAVPLAALLAGVLVPADYTLTEHGVLVGKTTYRRWTEFSGVTIRKGRVRFKNIHGVRRLEIWLPGRFHDAEVVTDIRRLIRGAYTGRGAPNAAPAEEPDAGEDLAVTALAR